jgi:hypothetical protein
LQPGDYPVLFTVHVNEQYLDIPALLGGDFKRVEPYVKARDERKANYQKQLKEIEKQIKSMGKPKPFLERSYSNNTKLHVEAMRAKNKNEIQKKLDTDANLNEDEQAYVKENKMSKVITVEDLSDSDGGDSYVSEEVGEDEEQSASEKENEKQNEKKTKAKVKQIVYIKSLGNP